MGVLLSDNHYTTAAAQCRINTASGPSAIIVPEALFTQSEDNTAMRLAFPVSKKVSWLA